MLCAQPLLAWHSLPVARFFGTPVGAGAPLRKCLTAAPLAHVCDESRWRSQAGGIAGCRSLQHLQMPLPARLAQRCSTDGPCGCQVELHADSCQCCCCAQGCCAGWQELRASASAALAVTVCRSRLPCSAASAWFHSCAARITQRSHSGRSPHSASTTAGSRGGACPRHSRCCHALLQP